MLKWGNLKFSLHVSRPAKCILYLAKNIFLHSLICTLAWKYTPLDVHFQMHFYRWRIENTNWTSAREKVFFAVGKKCTFATGIQCRTGDADAAWCLMPDDTLFVTRVWNTDTYHLHFGPKKYYFCSRTLFFRSVHSLSNVSFATLTWKILQVKCHLLLSLPLPFRISPSPSASLFLPNFKKQIRCTKRHFSLSNSLLPFNWFTLGPFVWPSVNQKLHLIVFPDKCLPIRMLSLPVEIGSTFGPIDTCQITWKV